MTAYFRNHTLLAMLPALLLILIDGIREAGVHEVRFEAAGLPNGTYLYRLETPQGSFVKTMHLIK